MHLRAHVAWGVVAFLFVALRGAPVLAANVNVPCSNTTCDFKAPLENGALVINLALVAPVAPTSPIHSAKIVQMPSGGPNVTKSCTAPAALVGGAAALTCQVDAQANGTVVVTVESAPGTTILHKAIVIPSAAPTPPTTTTSTTTTTTTTATAEGQGETELPALARLSPEQYRKTIGRFGLTPQDGLPRQYYNRRDDVAVLFFNADGEPFGPIPNTIDENDDIYVVVVDTVENLSTTAISLSGCNRPPLAPRILGKDEKTKGIPETSKDLDIDVKYRVFGKCAGANDGGPAVTIQRGKAQAKSITIPVNPLYRFSVGAALAYDATETREFALRTPAGSSVTRVAESEDRIGLSSLIYVSLYLLPRDLRKDQLFLWERLQVFAGLDPRAFDKHLILGLGYELAPGFSLLGGWRVATKQPILAEGSGLRVTSSFDGDLADLPTRERWEFGSGFIGVGLNNDLLTRLR